MTTTMTKTIDMEFPRFDGHIWVERNGKIIDPHFPQYNMTKKINGCVGEPIYLEAPEETQTIVIGIMKKRLQQLLEEDFEGALESLYVLYELFDNLKPQYRRCLQNSFIEIYKKGGRLVFGSMGWKRKNGTIHYEFGGEDYKTWKDFKK
jgi:hypothetical protein